MAKMGFSSWLILAVLTSQGAWARPKDVKLITVPRPGQEYVNIQSSVFSQQAQPRSSSGHTEDSFATSHKYPGELPADEEYDAEEEMEVVETPSKIKRESVDAQLTEDLQPPAVPAEQLTSDLLPQEDGEEAQDQEEEDEEVRTEVRMEFSVATSKPRKETKDGAEKTSRGFAKVAPIEKKVATKPAAGASGDVRGVEVDSKGNFGKLAANYSGADEKKVMLKRQSASEATSKAVASKKVAAEQTLKEVEIKPASEVGVKSPKVEMEEGSITVPVQKQQSSSSSIHEATTTPVTTLTSQAPVDKGFDILPVNHIAKKSHADKEIDFDFVDSPLADKVLVPAGSNQQSRIEVKKGPNGQEYEYEYVYYYYDDDENDAAADDKKSTDNDKKSTSAKTSTAASTSAEPATTSRQYLPEAIPHADKDAGDHARGRGRNRNQAHVDVPEKEFGGRTKSAPAEKTKGAVPETSNEIIPARGTHTRSRGRTATTPVTTEEPSTLSAEERLPSNTRFPPRSRSNHNSNSVASTTPAAAAVPHVAAQDTPVTRIRGGSSANSVRRPSLELVDSSSFKTHSSDASRDQDLRPEFPSRLPEGPVRFLGVTADEEDEPVKPRGSRLRGSSTTTTSTTSASVEDEEEDEEDADISDAPRRGQPIRRPSVASRTPVGEEEEEEEVDEDTNVADVVGEAANATVAAETGLSADAMDKAAIELYSHVQQAQAENSIDESTDLSEDELTTELEDMTTTPEPPTTTTTTTTTTTPGPTTTTTTTTEEPSTTTGRGRYRQGARGPAGSTGPRNRFRSGNTGSSAEVTSTTEAPAETSTKARAKFGSNRVTSGNYGRRGFQKSTTSAPEDSDKEVQAVREVQASAAPAPVRANAFSRNRFSASRPSRVTSTTTTSAPSEDSESASSSSSAPAKPQPAFADRFNSLRRRGGAKATTATPAPAEESKSESSGEEASEQATVSEAASTTVKPQGRTRLSIGSGPRPVRPGPRVNIGTRGRLGVSTTTTQAPSTEADEASNEQTSSSSQDESASQSDEVQEVVTTVVPDALTRLRNRSRLRVTAVRPVASSTTAPVRRPLGLLPRRRPQTAEATKESSESETQDSSNASSNSEESEPSSSSDETSEPSTDAASGATAAQDPPPENNRLSSLLNGRRKGHALRRPQTQFSAAGR